MQTFYFSFCIFSILADSRNQLCFVGYGYGYIHGYPRKICGYGYGYGWEISYPRQPCQYLHLGVLYRLLDSRNLYKQNVSITLCMLPFIPLLTQTSTAVFLRYSILHHCRWLSELRERRQISVTSTMLMCVLLGCT